MIRCLLVDDEPLAHEVLISYCGKVDDISIVGQCYDAVSAHNFLRNNEVDLMFLDIQMGDMTGIEMLSAVNNPPLVIFVTAYSEYALESYEFDAVDYLVKPVRFPRFLKAIDKIKNRTENNVRYSDNPNEKSDHSKQAEFISVENEGAKQKIYLKDILCITSYGNYAEIRTPNKNYLERRTLTELSEVLSDSGFLRVHKSYLVNMSKVKALDGNRLIVGDDQIPIGATYKKLVQEGMRGV